MQLETSRLVGEGILLGIGIQRYAAWIIINKRELDTRNGEPCHIYYKGKHDNMESRIRIWIQRYKTLHIINNRELTSRNRF